MKRRICFYLIPLVFFMLNHSCSKHEEENRFPLAGRYNIDGVRLTEAFNEMKKVEGALSLIVCSNGTIVAEEYTNYNTHGAGSIKNIMSVTKTFTGVLIGPAIDKGFIESVDDPISKYLTGIVTFPDDIKAGITIDKLLKWIPGMAGKCIGPPILYGNGPGRTVYLRTTGPQYCYHCYLLDLRSRMGTGRGTLDKYNQDHS
jgi:hypothetical protein